VDFGEGIQGEQLIGKLKESEWEEFSEAEVEVLQEVVNTIGKASSKTDITISHEQFAWQHNTEEKSPISYQYGFHLKHVQ